MSLSMYGGPADDQSFACRRRPELLRIVCSQAGTWDCLDLLDDIPRPRETIYLYECFRRGSGVFICGPGMGAASGHQAHGDYRFIVRATGELHRLAQRAGIRKRVAPHQFRHAWTIDALRDGMSLPMIQRQLGHANLAITTRYLAGIAHEELLEEVFRRHAPSMSVPDLMAVLDTSPVPSAPIGGLHG